MRVLYFTGAYRPDSMVSHTHGELVAALRARGVAVEIATIGTRDQATAVASEKDDYGTVVWRIRPASGPLARIRRAYSARVWAFPPFADVVRALRAFLTPQRLAEYDLLHVGMVFPYATAFRHALQGRIHPAVIVNITGGDILTETTTGYGYGRLPTTRRAIRRTIDWATLVQANSPRTARIVQRYGASPAHIAVQPHQSAHKTVLASEVMNFRAQAHVAFETAGVLPPGRILLGLGRMVPIKGFDDAIRALPAILREHPDTSMVFAGPTRDAAASAYRASLEALAAALGVRDRVHFPGQLDFTTVPRYFAASSLALIPSLIDGLNMTGVEAGGVGTPSVVSEAAGLADYVREYGAGVVVPPRDPQALAAAIIQLLGDDAAWHRASAGALSMAETFSLAHTADGIFGLYERVIQPT